MNVLSLFDGISCGMVALERLGIKVDNYFASEINGDAIKISKSNYPKIIQLGDVTKLEIDKLPKIDLMIGGSPCQGFSFAGKGLNFDDPRSKLFFEFVKIRDRVNPKWWMLENNRMKGEWSDIITQYMGVDPIEINSNLVSAQNRRRIYWTNIPNIDIPEDRGIMLKDIVGEYNGIWVYPRGFNKGGVQSYGGKSPTITTSNWEHNFFIWRDEKKEKFRREWCEILQTLPVGYTREVSNNKAIKHIGNAWTVDVICHILKNIK